MTAQNLVYDDLVYETTSSSGTTDFTLSGAVSANFQRFQDVMAVNDWCSYEAQVGAERESGIGRLTATTTLERHTVIESSNADAKVNFTSSPNVRLTWIGKAAQPLHDAQYDYLINGNGQVNQEAAASIADGAYGHDQWYALVQTGAIAPSSLTDVEDTLPNMMRLTQSQASAQRFGYAQVIEAQRCKKLRGKTVTFGGRLRYSNAAALRFYVLEWTGTADAVTIDVVNDWTSGTYTGGNFFKATTTTVTGGSSLTPSANTLTDFRITVTLGSSFNNLIVFVFTEGTSAQNSTLDIAAKLVRGYIISPYYRSLAEELTLSMRYWESSYEQGTPPGTATGTGTFALRGLNATDSDILTLPFVVPKRVAPTMTAYNNVTGGSGTWRDGTSNNDRNISFFNVSTKNTWITVAVSSNGAQINGHYVANARL